MDKFLVLGPSFGGTMPTTRKYKGVERVDMPEVPVFQGKAEAINSAIEKHINSTDISTGYGDFFSSYETALQISKVYTENNENADVYEVIQVVTLEEEPPRSKSFLGYDVLMVGEHGSAIANFLANYVFFDKQNMNPSIFINSMNDNLLFENLDVALKFSEAMEEILEKTIRYKIVALFR